MSKSPSGPAPAALAPTEVLAGRYRIVSVLSPPGPGTLGTTYAALDLAGSSAARSSQSSGNHELTLRVLADPGSAGGASSLSEEERARFAQQAARLGTVRHPAVARTNELGLLPELGVFLAREPVESEGQTLRDVLSVRGGPLSEQEAILLCAQIGEALDAAHLQGACHLGLSPSCIFVYPDGSGVRIKVADFGLLPPAWAARIGEAGYLAPEQIDGPPGASSCDRRTDQFALAVILYEMLAGQPAFIAVADEDRRIILGRVRNEDPLPLAQSRGVEQALARALSRSRAVRFPTVRDFVRALGADVSGWPSSLPAASGPLTGGHSPRLFLPLAAGALFALLSLGAVMALRQAFWPPAARGWTVGSVDLAASPVAAAPPKYVTHEKLSSKSGAAADGGSTDATTPMDGGAQNPPPDLRSGPRPSDLGAAPEKIFGPPPTKTPPLRNNNSEATPLPMQFGGEANLLTTEQRAQLISCVKMITPQPPFEVWLPNINGILYVDQDRSSAQFAGSQDFRDCLKLSVKGKIVPKVLTITQKVRGKAAP